MIGHRVVVLDALLLEVDARARPVASLHMDGDHEQVLLRDLALRPLVKLGICALTVRPHRFTPAYPCPLSFW